jgi:hypothetical protein
MLVFVAINNLKFLSAQEICNLIMIKASLLSQKPRTLGQNYAPTVTLRELEKLVEREIKTTQSWKARSTTGETIASPSGCLMPHAMYLGANTAGPARIFRFHRTSEPRGSRRRHKPFFRAHTIKYTWNSQAYGTGTKGGVKIEQTRQKSSPLSSGTDRIKRTCDAGQHLNRQLIDDMGAVMPKNWWFAAATAYFVERDTLPFFTRLWGFVHKETSDTDMAQAGETALQIKICDFIAWNLWFSYKYLDFSSKQKQEQQLALIFHFSLESLCFHTNLIHDILISSKINYN